MNVSRASKIANLAHPTAFGKKAEKRHVNLGSKSISPEVANILPFLNREPKTSYLAASSKRLRRTMPTS